MKKEGQCEKRFGLSVSLCEEESEMVNKLRKSPYCINMSEFIRDSIRKLHKEKVEKIE
jgi:Arc/MetJ-type ribon-helix-helix transcriptional regulator